MSYFKVKMHQIRFRLGLCPRPHRESSQHSPRSLTRIEGILLLREREEMEREWKGREGKAKGKKRKKGGGGWREEMEEEGCVMALGDERPCQAIQTEY